MMSLIKSMHILVWCCCFSGVIAAPVDKAHREELDPIAMQLFTPRMDERVKVHEKINYVVVRKQDRKLDLYAGSKIIKSYNIALGQQPIGQKFQEGDSRTPEGIYSLDWRNPNSRFFRSIHVDYPNEKQMKEAKAKGINPGGEIMIHGQPSDWDERIELTFRKKDWTEGCIALENQDMMEVWNLVEDNTVIHIKP